MKETEEDFKSWVIALAKLYGWKCAHFRPGMTNKGWRTPVEADGGGFPDLVMVRLTRLLFVELKSDKGRLSQGQGDWLAQLKASKKAEVYLFYPKDRDSIIEILR